MHDVKKAAFFVGIGFLLIANPGCIYGEYRGKTAAAQVQVQSFSLEDYIRTAKKYESLITGEDEQKIPEGRIIVSSQEENSARVASIASQVKDGGWHTFYVIGKNTVPNGRVIARRWGSQAVYANLLEEVIQQGEDLYYVARMGVQKASGAAECSHQWKREGGEQAGCLTKSSFLLICEACGEEQEVTEAPLGHLDEDGDSLCDRCRHRTEEQVQGSVIQAKLGQEPISFTCIDEDFQGGMLYLADRSVPLEFFGGYGQADYGNSLIFRYFRDGFQNGCSMGKALMRIETHETPSAAYAMSLSKGEYEKYRDQIAGGNFLLRDSQGGSVWAVDEGGAYSLQNPESTHYGIRIAIVLQKPDFGIPERIHWNLNDLQTVRLDGKEYLFRCIDQDYSDGQQNHGQLALFLCDSVIPANYGSDYRSEQQEDGSHEYVFRPGPMAQFGDENDYKYSNIRNWLDSQKIFNTEPVQIGSDYAYMGSSPKGARSDFDTNALKAYHIGNQQLNAHLFILSVDEALKYREYLWKFEGSDTENPETQYGAFSKGYWLRSPMGNSEEFHTGYAYVVDLVNGNIHPEAVKAEGGKENAQQDQTTVYGIRPAFVMPQD